MVSFTQLFTTGLLANSALAIPVAKPFTVEVQRRISTSKRGAAYNEASLVSPLSSSGTISWAYNWAFSAYGSLPSGVEYVPMLWGAKDFGGWVAAVETALSSGSSYIMGFNEPDMTSQANMSPSQAASFYKNFITPYSGRAKLISPAVTSSTTAGLGLSWFQEFISDCSSCGITGLAVHWYGNTVDEFKSFVTQAVSTAHSHGLSEVWLTEFALNQDVNGISNPAATAAFLNEVLPWLDAQSGVTRYAYFYLAKNYLVSDSVLNQAGHAYAS